MKNIGQVFQVLTNPEFAWSSFFSAVAAAVMQKVFGVPIFIGYLALSLTITLDWLSGTSAAEKDGSYASQWGIEGLKRTASMLLLPLFGMCVDYAFGSPGYATMGLLGGLIYNTLKSCLANYARTGWDRWMPVGMLDWLASEIEAKTQRSANRKPTEKGEDVQ